MVQSLGTQPQYTDRVLTGADGTLFYKDQPLMHVDEFTATSGWRNDDLHPIGGYEVLAIPVAVMYRIELSEPTVLDLANAGALLNDLQTNWMSGKVVPFKLSGHQLDPRDRSIVIRTITFEYCVPDGDISIMEIRPGQIQRRRWNLRANGRPVFTNLGP